MAATPAAAGPRPRRGCLGCLPCCSSSKRSVSPICDEDDPGHAADVDTRGLGQPGHGVGGRLEGRGDAAEPSGGVQSLEAFAAPPQISMCCAGPGSAADRGGVSEAWPARAAEVPEERRGGGRPRLEDLPVGDEVKGRVQVFVHGSGDCDQLGLGDAVRERTKPTLMRSLAGVRIRSIACGGLHTVAVTDRGTLLSWGCNDDGALGRCAGGAGEAADCEPGEVALPAGVVVRSVACGDSHTCALEDGGRVWIWGSYKDSSGYIGLRQPGGEVVEKSSTPCLAVGLDDVASVSSGSNHTVARTSRGSVFCWGSNQTGQLGLASKLGCEFVEEEVPLVDAQTVNLIDCGSRGTLVSSPHRPDCLRILRVRLKSGGTQDVSKAAVVAIPELLAQGNVEVLVLEARRDVPVSEKHQLLTPQRLRLEGLDAEVVEGAFASSECTFVAVRCSGQDSKTFACGLNGYGQAGVGFTSACVPVPTEVLGLTAADWIGGGVHMSAALVGGRVFTWGNAEECGQGSCANDPPVLRPRLLVALPQVREVRCGMCHTLACSKDGDVFAWGCGISGQLGNAPKNCDDAKGEDDEPGDELAPYLISSKRLRKRFVLFADGGAQHSVEIAWDQDSSEAGGAESSEEEGATAGRQHHGVGSTADGYGEDAEEREVLQVHTSAEFWRVQVEAIYRRRNPYKLDNVPALLEKYEGQEATLYVKVCQKYYLDPAKWYADPASWEGEEGDVMDYPADGDNANGTTTEAQGASADAERPALVFGGLFSKPDGSASPPPPWPPTDLFKLPAAPALGEVTTSASSDEPEGDESPEAPSGKRRKKKRSADRDADGSERKTKKGAHIKEGRPKRSHRGTDEKS
mmetsp:Transcript_155058/g.497090  ORF Transcript_155058/g.497090 Transcript_155058/m.497090 type:complete len:857 (+) Transcript_155058:45-2615(+)